MSTRTDIADTRGIRRMAPRSSKAEALNTLGMNAVQRGEIRESLGLFEQAVAIDPAYADAHYNLGKALKDLGSFKAAAEVLRRVVKLLPSDGDAWYVLGNTCAALEEPDEAERCYRTALRLRPDDTRIYNNLTVTLQALGHLDEAHAVASVGLALNSGYPDLHYNRGLVSLLKGMHADGWKEFEWRFHTSDRANPLRADVVPRWDGSTLNGRRILLSAEQGLGDTLQFVRFARHLQERGARVLVECSGELCRLIRTVPGVASVFSRGEVQQAYDTWSPLLSIPHLAGITDERSYGAAVPYLFPDPSEVAEWRARLQGTGEGMRIGVVWAGNPHHKNDHNRSCPPALFERLLTVPRTVWYTLQTGGETRDGLHHDRRLIDLTDNLPDFAATAAFVSTLDLVITVDTAVAHLAGALGKPVWLLLPFAPDWRWMLRRSDSPWYPSMRLFRQQQRGGWEKVFDQVRSELQEATGGAFPSPVPSQPLKPLRFSWSWPGAGITGTAAPPQSEDYGALLAYGDALCQAGLRLHAITVYRRILDRRPELPAAWNNLGVCLQQEGNVPEAIAAFERAVELDHRCAATASNLGSALYEHNLLTRARDVLQRALQLDPTLANAHNNMGNVLRALGDFAGARRAFDSAIRWSPDFPEPHWNMAQLLLQEGDYIRGWEEYEWRWRRTDFTSPVRPFRQPCWNGETLHGKTILVHAEQGFGDALQFVRYVHVVLQTGAIVVVECQRELVRLFRNLDGIRSVVAYGDPLPHFDVHVPLMSLPRICKTTLQTIPAEIPYLAPDTGDVIQWRNRLQSEGLSVGVVWSGTQHLKSLRSRSCPLVNLMPLFRIPGTSMWSLQIGDAVHDLDVVPPEIRPRDLSPYIHDFGDTAAAVSVLDLVITIDTAVAHVAGALGTPVWVMLPRDPDWRWMRERDGSPWYPGMRLFRQARAQEWSGVLSQIAESLRTLASRKGEKR